MNFETNAAEQDWKKSLTTQVAHSKGDGVPGPGHYEVPTCFQTKKNSRQPSIGTPRGSAPQQTRQQYVLAQTEFVRSRIASLTSEIAARDLQIAECKNKLKSLGKLPDSP
eukprot:TRINITY_DN22405_c0_g1_i1.p1 TRINITY_DN22405_c0_g1~~TRINITY_DN22405_c0_g1_i1.p1  ORF type:complete len:110 (+),score=5.09 TRINITY_DN22405_c0_g1_i1:40-369(+)